MRRRVLIISGLVLVLCVVVFFSFKLTLAQTASSTSTIQASTRSNLQIIRQTKNSSSGALDSSTYEANSPVHVVISVFSPADMAGPINITDSISDLKKDAQPPGSVKNVKLFLPDGSESTSVGSSVNYSTSVINFALSNLDQGENKIEYDYEVSE